LKFIKFGFWRPHGHASYKIWNGYLNRKEAIDKINEVQYQLPAYLDEFLEYHELTEKLFYGKIEELRNKKIWEM